MVVGNCTREDYWRWMTLFFVIIVVVLGVIIFRTMVNQLNESVEYCNEKYGVENWSWKNIDKFGYIGQAWECVPFMTLEEDDK